MCPQIIILSTCRSQRRGGGIANIFKDIFQCKQASYGDFTSFECLCALIKCSPNILLVTIYRPPRCSAHAFLDEFRELLSTICLQYDCIIVSVDFNLHVDDPKNTSTKEFLTLIDTFSFTQHVQGPTHSHGHTLDLVITKGLNVSTTVMDIALSDHLCVVFNVCTCISVYHTTPATISRRVINSNTGFLFEQALSQALSHRLYSVDDPLKNFNSKMAQIMDDIAPLKPKKALASRRHLGLNIHQLRCIKGNVGGLSRNGANPKSPLTIRSIKICCSNIIMKYIKQGSLILP